MIGGDEGQSREWEGQALHVLHRIPGRLRLAVLPLHGQALQRLVASAQQVRGVTAAAIGASGRNIVVCFVPRQVTEETLLMRLALSLSALGGYCPVRVVRERKVAGVGQTALGAGAVCVIASLAGWALPTSRLAALSGWTASVLTMLAIGSSMARDLLRGRAKPQGLALVHLLLRLRNRTRGQGALLAWLLYHGPLVAQRLESPADAVELRPVTLRQAVGQDHGPHVEVLTRPVRTAGVVEGRMLTPATVMSALMGFFAYALERRVRPATEAGK